MSPPPRGGGSPSHRRGVAGFDGLMHKIAYGPAPAPALCIISDVPRFGTS